MAGYQCNKFIIQHWKQTQHIIKIIKTNVTVKMTVLALIVLTNFIFFEFYIEVYIESANDFNKTVKKINIKNSTFIFPVLINFLNEILNLFIFSINLNHIFSWKFLTEE